MGFPIRFLRTPEHMMRHYKVQRSRYELPFREDQFTVEIVPSTERFIGSQAYAFRFPSGMPNKPADRALVALMLQDGGDPVRLFFLAAKQPAP